MSNDDISRAVGKIIKKLKSKDDNDKLASLAYITKVFKTPEELSKSEYAPKIWESLRSTQFLERALRSEETQQLVFMIISTFSHFVPSSEISPFVRILSKIMNNDFECDACKCLIEISQNIEDLSILFEYVQVSVESLKFFIQATSTVKKCKMTPSVFNARAAIFNIMKTNQDLEVRKLLFLLVSNMVQANDEFAIFSSQSKIDLVPFLAIERLALIELRLQLDVPLNYQEIEENEKKKRELDDIEYKKNKAKYEKKDDYFDEEEEVKVEPIKFSQDIGPLINPELSASSCQLLESLVIPLVNHEDDLNDTEILQYLDTLDSILNETVSIFSAVKGQRDCDRNELKCLFSLFAGWLRDAPFLCENTSTLNSLKSIISKLWWFPNEALQLIPAFTTWSESSNARPLMKASFNDLAKRLKEYSTPAESQAIDELISKVYLCK